MNPFDVSNEHGIYPGKEFQSEKHWSHLSVHLVCMYRTSCCIAQTSITNANILKSHSWQHHYLHRTRMNYILLISGETIPGGRTWMNMYLMRIKVYRMRME
jgi:hypothetical protein